MHNLQLHFIIISAKNVELKLEDILMFFTGTADIPPNGFHAIPTVNFSYSEVFPTAATCFNELTLPTKYNWQPQVFRETFIFAISNHRGFGAPSFSFFPSVIAIIYSCIYSHDCIYHCIYFIELKIHWPCHYHFNKKGGGAVSVDKNIV